MELETLEVIIEANLEKMEEQFARIMPFVEKTMTNVSRVTGQGIDKTEQNMSVDKGVKQLTEQFEKMTKLFEKQMEAMNKTASTGSEDIGKGMSKGFTKARKQVGKDVDVIINEINSKMGQAKAQQEKLAFLKSQRQGAVSSNNTKGTIKFDEQIARAQAAMTKYQDSARSLARSIQDEFNAVPGSLDNISKSMMQNEGQIEKLRSRIKQLQADYANQKMPVGSFKDGFKNIGETKSSAKTAIEIEKQSAKMQKLVTSNDALQQAYASTEDRAEQLKTALSKINTELGESTVKTGTASESIKKVAKGTNESRNNFSRFGGLFNRTSNNIAHGSKRMSKGMGSFGSRIKGIVKQVFVFSMIYKGLKLVSQGLAASLQTNDQFNQSLNQIKVNMLTAFYPIYEFILPAINALMRALATVTGQIAAFSASLFGTSYTTAKKGASGLYQNIQAMNDSGAAADKNKEKIKKLQRSLMGFDEINRIGLSDEEDDSLDSNVKQPGVDFNAVGNYAIPDSVKKMMDDFFKPFKDSWDKHGKTVINAWKYMLKEVGGLVQAIGKSFIEVWTDGTGERLISNLLLLLANVLNIIGDIAKAFKDAWNDGGRGTKLIQSIFDMFNNILELINEIGYAFSNVWNNGTGELVAANLLEIFTNLFNIIGNIAGQLKKAWKEGKNGEKIFQGIFDLINIVLGTLNDITKATADWAKQLDFTPLLQSIHKLLEAMQPLTENIGGGLKWLFDNVLLPLANFTITEVIPAFLDLLSAALELLNSVIELAKPLFIWLWDNFLQPIASWTGGAFVKILETITAAIKKLADIVNEPKKAFKDLEQWTAEKWNNIFGSVDKNSKNAELSGLKSATVLKSGFNLDMENIASNAKIRWEDISNRIKSNSEFARDKASNAWQIMKDRVGGFNDQIRSHTETTFNSVVNWASDLGNRIGRALKSGFEAVKSGARKIGEGIFEFPKRAVNGVLGGVRWVLEKVGASSAAGNIKDYTFAYAQGTGYHPGGPALVNDGYGMNYQEAYRLPNGQTGLFPKARNLLVDLPAGSSVMSGPRTASMLSNNIPQYANGVGDWFKEKWDGIKEFTGDVWDYVSEPGKLLNIGISKMVNLSGAFDPALSMAKGVISTTASAATDFIKQKMDEFFDGGDADTSTSGMMGVMSYLSNIASDVMNKFPGMQATSGYRHGDPHSHGKRQAIDIAYPSNMNGSQAYFKPANYAFEKFRDKVAYVITQGMVRDRSGMSGQGKSGNWVRWPENDHYDHLHINGAIAQGQGGSSNAGGTGVERWRSTIQRALAANGLPTNATYTNAWLRQVQSESGGRETVIGGNDGLADGNAMGLLQVKPGTFNAYKHQGYNNILRGLDNALAAINYAKNRYGFSGMLGVIGHGHGYAKGTPWVPEDQLAMIHKGEMVVPAQFNPNNMNSTLTMPDLFTIQQNDTNNTTFNSSSLGGGGISAMSESIVTAIINAAQQKRQSSNPTGDIIINIGGKEFGRIAVSEINKYHTQIGHTELNL